MQELKSILDDAAAEGVITADQSQPLTDYLVARGIHFAEPAKSVEQSRGLMADLSRPRDEDDAAQLRDSEAPRFIRGFHDVLITIGVVVALAGLWGIATVYSALAAIIVLAEILVRRQRLALPAVVLTLALCYAVGDIMATSLRPLYGQSINVALFFLAPFPFILTLYYLRYRIPVSLAILVFSIFSFLLMALFYGLAKITGSNAFFYDYRLLAQVIILASAIALFALAMYFDLKDPARVTRRSDVAFWLHLGAAPALLYAMLSFVFLRGGELRTAFTGNLGYGDAVAVVIIVAAMMLIGLIIDRRAFVTSGLVSLGGAIATILQQSQTAFGTYAFATLLIVGLIVLVIGVGWPHLRRAVVGGLPVSLKSKLPPLI